MHIHIYKCIYVSVFALAVRLDVAIAFLCALLAMKRGGCQRCGSVLRGRGVGYCWWCKTYSSGSVVSESPGSLWLMSQGALDVPCVDWRIAMHCGTAAAGMVGDDFLALAREVDKTSPRMLDLMISWPWLQKSTKPVPGGSI